MTEQEFLDKVKNLQYLPLDISYAQTGEERHLKRAAATALNYFSIDTKRLDVVRSRMMTHVNYAFLLNDIKVTGYDVYARQPEDQAMGTGNLTGCLGDLIAYALSTACPELQGIATKTFDPYTGKVKWTCWHKTTFVVIDNNTFGYTEKDTTTGCFPVNIMAVDAYKGGDPYKINTSTYARKGTWRVATTADFERFRVSIKGYLNNPNYIINKR